MPSFSIISTLLVSVVQLSTSLPTGSGSALSARQARSDCGFFPPTQIIDEGFNNGVSGLKTFQVRFPPLENPFEFVCFNELEANNAGFRVTADPGRLDQDRPGSCPTAVSAVQLDLGTNPRNIILTKCRVASPSKRQTPPATIPPPPPPPVSTCRGIGFEATTMVEISEDVFVLTFPGVSPRQRCELIGAREDAGGLIASDNTLGEDQCRPHITVRGPEFEVANVLQRICS